MQNVPSLERAIRLASVIAVAASYAIGLFGGTLALVLGAAVFVVLLTSLISICPAYMPFALSTRPKIR